LCALFGTNKELDIINARNNHEYNLRTVKPVGNLEVASEQISSGRVLD